MTVFVHGCPTGAASFSCTRFYKSEWSLLYLASRERKGAFVAWGALQLEEPIMSSPFGVPFALFHLFTHILTPPPIYPWS